MSLSIAWSLLGESDAIDDDQSYEWRLLLAIDCVLLIGMMSESWFLTKESLTLRSLRGGFMSLLNARNRLLTLLLLSIGSESVSDLERHLPRRFVVDDSAAFARGAQDARLLRVGCGRAVLLLAVLELDTCLVSLGTGVENETGIEFERERRFWRLDVDDELAGPAAAESSCSVNDRGPMSSSDVASDIPDPDMSKEMGDITPSIVAGRMLTVRD
jgi:hypothetical protein